MGRRPQRLRLGDRHLARPAAGPVLGQRLLEARRAGLVSRPRILERPQDRPARLPQERPPRRSPRRRAGRAARGRLLLHPRPVLPRRRRRGLEAGLLGQGPARLGVGPRAVDPPARRLEFQEATGIAPSKTAAPCSPPPRSTSRRRKGGDVVYQPYTQVSPQSYGLLYGAFGRPTPLRRLPRLLL